MHIHWGIDGVVSGWQMSEPLSLCREGFGWQLFPRPPIILNKDAEAHSFRLDMELSVRSQLDDLIVLNAGLESGKRDVPSERGLISQRTKPHVFDLDVKIIHRHVAFRLQYRGDRKSELLVPERVRGVRFDGGLLCLIAHLQYHVRIDCLQLIHVAQIGALHHQHLQSTLAFFRQQQVHRLSVTYVVSCNGTLQQLHTLQAAPL
mmetsp:Transcript_108366/g.183530  ORF Transcript_108366/g.183530 Transcript_108366/m.183530 type:complete len:204 (-) Transcript_108366:1296-1907(-)